MYYPTLALIITGAQASSYPHAIISDSIDDVQATLRAIFFRLSISPHDVKGYRDILLIFRGYHHGNDSMDGNRH